MNGELTDFDRWLVERRTQADEHRAVSVPNVPPPTWAAAVGIPLAQAGAIGAVGGLTSGVVIGLLAESFAVGLRWGAGLGALAAGGFAVQFMLEERWLRTSPIKLAREKLWASMDKPEPPPRQADPGPRFIPINSKYVRPALTAPTPMAPTGTPALAAGRESVQTALRGWADRLAARQGAGQTVESTTPQLMAPRPADTTPAWVKEMYSVLVATHSTNALSRRQWEQLFEGGRGLWTRYVAGDPSKGKHRGKSIFQLWNVIAPGPRGSWVYSQPWHVIMNLDRALQAYARELGTADHPPSVPLAEGQNTEPGYVQSSSVQATSPIVQTEGGTHGG